MDQVTPQVTIIDPAHPFFGRTFPLVRRNSPHGQPHVVVVPQVATDFETNETTLQQPLDRPFLPVISVPTILPLARLVKTKIRAAEEKSYERSLSSRSEEPTPVVGQAARPSAEVVASPHCNSAPAIGPATGPPHSAAPHSPIAGGQS